MRTCASIRRVRLSIPENAIELVAEVGYVPLPEEAFELAQKKVEAGRTGTFFGGESKIGVQIEDLLRVE
jgi:phosphate transport system substrate-binding protein